MELISHSDSLRFWMTFFIAALQGKMYRINIKPIFIPCIHFRQIESI